MKKYYARIEQIETSKYYDILDISNRKPCLWILSLFNGYKQFGQFKVIKPHNYHEGQDIIIRMLNNKIIGVRRE